MKMLKGIITLFTLLLIQQPLLAQDWISVGPRVGLNYTNQAGDNIEPDYAFGLVAGITSTFSLRERSGLTVELLYAEEGAESLEEVELDLSYLRLPILYNIFFRDVGDAFRPKIYIGLQPGLLLEAEIDEADRTDSYNSFALGGTVGIGFNYQVGEELWLNTDLRYNRGFTDIAEDTAFFEGDIYNQGFQLSLGLAFGL